MSKDTSKIEQIGKLKQYPSMSERRVEWWIRTGRRWRAMTFDEVA